MWILLIFACRPSGLVPVSDHDPSDDAGGEETAAPDTGTPGWVPSDDDRTHEFPDDEPPEDTGEPPPEDTEEPSPFEDCTEGYQADYYNLPADHPEVEQAITGVVPGDLPWNHDWYDATWFAFRQHDPGLDFGSGWFPVDTGLPGDPYYFAVHWVAEIDVKADGIASFELGSDDDGWAAIDGAIVADLGGVHGVAATTFDVPLTKGQHHLELWMAERHTSDAGFWFRFLSDVDVWACP